MSTDRIYSRKRIDGRIIGLERTSSIPTRPFHPRNDMMIYLLGRRKKETETVQKKNVRHRYQFASYPTSHPPVSNDHPLQPSFPLYISPPPPNLFQFSFWKFIFLSHTFFRLTDYAFPFELNSIKFNLNIFLNTNKEYQTSKAPIDIYLN